MAFLIFCVLLFPEKRASELAVEKLNSLFPAYRFSIDQVRPVFPLGVRAVNSKILMPGGTAFVFQSASLFPDPLSLFNTYKKADFKAFAYNGSLTGSVSGAIPFSMDRGKLQLHVTGMEINGWRLNKDNANVRLSFILGGDFIYQAPEGEVATGRGNISASGCKVLVKNTMFDSLGLSAFDFERIDMDFRLRSDLLKFLSFSASGSQVDLTATGSVTLRRPLEKSRLNLKGRIKPHSDYFAQFPKLFSVVMMLGDSKKGGIPFTVSGTFDKPLFSL
ncbi:MAG: type II secretion system protein GspN [Desulfobacteraceae bacterium]|nr:type II secretion system protein GspN [Desulfobacteraceae bacterium]